VSEPASYAAGSSVTLNAVGSAAACNHSISSYSWSVGGAVISTAATATQTAPATGAAATVVQLTVTDDAGKTDTTTINVGPTSAQSTSPASAGSTACLNDVVPPGGAPITVTIAATDPNAAEAGADPGVFTISRSGSTAAALTVTLAYSGTATNGTDYTALASGVTIPAGSASATVTVTPIDDPTAEGAETVVATVQAASGYVVGDPSSATVTIADNDTAAAPTPASGSKGGGGGAFDPLTLLAALSFAVFAALRRLRVVRRDY